MFINIHLKCVEARQHNQSLKKSRVRKLQIISPSALSCTKRKKVWLKNQLNCNAKINKFTN